MHTAITAISSPPPRSFSLLALKQQVPLSSSTYTFIRSSSSSSFNYSSFSSLYSLSSSSSHLFSTQPSHPLTSNNSNKRKISFHFSLCPNCKQPRPTIMAIAELSRISPHGPVDRPRWSQHQHHYRLSSTLSTPPPQQQDQHWPMLTSLHLQPNPYATYDFMSEPHQAAGGSILQPCKGVPQIAFETDYRLLGSPRAVAMTIAAMSSSSVKTANVGNPINGPISIYDLAQSRRQFYFHSSISPSPSLTPSSFPLPYPCTRHNNSNNKRYNVMHPHNCSLDDVRSKGRRCQVDCLWLNPNTPQEQQPLMDYPSGDCQSMESMIEDVEEVEEEEFNWKFALEEMEMTLNKTLFSRSRSGLSSGTIETFERAYRTAAAIASDATPDHAAAVALFKHDDNDNSNDGSVFVLGVPSLTSSSLPSVSSQPPCCHTCTATSTATLSPLPYASTITSSTPLPPLPFPSATLFLDLSLSLSSSSSLLSATASCDANLRSPSPEQPNRSTTIDEASSSSLLWSPSLSPSFILPPPTSTALASGSSLLTSPTTTTTTTNTITVATGGFTLNDCKGSLDALASSAPTSSIALNYSSSFTNSTTFSNTILTPPVEQLLTDPEHFHLLCHPSIPSSMDHFNPTSCTPEPLPSSSSASSAAMSGLTSSNPGRNCTNQNGEPTGDCHYVSSRAATRCDHDHSDSDSGVDLDLSNRNGNLDILHRHRQHQERVDDSDIISIDEMRLRGEIMARISPRATMMSRTPPTLPGVPVWDEPVAHQIRRVQSAHMAELHRQWEDQQQQRRQAQVHEQQQQPLHQHQRHNSYPPIQRSVSMSRYVPVAMERSPPASMRRSTASFNTAATEAQLWTDEEMHLRTLARGSNSLYLNYEGGILRSEEQWRRGEDDMVGR